MLAAEESPWLDAPLSPQSGTDVPDVASADDDSDEGEDDESQSPWLDPQLPPRSNSSSGARYDFERDTQGWKTTGMPIVRVERSTAQHASGAASLALLVGGDGDAQAIVSNPRVRPGSTVSFRIFIPAGARLRFVQPYVQQGADANWHWTGNYQELPRLRQNAWNTLTVKAPANARAFTTLGVQLKTEGTWFGRIYVDNIRF